MAKGSILVYFGLSSFHGFSEIRPFKAGFPYYPTIWGPRSCEVAIIWPDLFEDVGFYLAFLLKNGLHPGSWSWTKPENAELEKGTSSEPNHHFFRFQLLIFKGVVRCETIFCWSFSTFWVFTTSVFWSSENAKTLDWNVFCRRNIKNHVWGQRQMGVISTNQN